MDHDDMSRFLFHSAFKVSDELVITPRPSDGGRVPKEHFPWFLGVAPIDYESRLEAELARYWGSFEKDKERAGVAGEAAGIEIHRPVTVYRRAPTA